MPNTTEPPRGLPTRPVAVLMACALGIAAGWLAWRAHRTRAASTDRAPDDWSKPAAFTAPVADTNAEKLRAEIEAAKERAEAARPFIAAASRADKEQIQSLMAAYSTALKPVREPPLLDLTAVTDLEQLRQKKETVQTFMKANENLRAFLARRETAYRETLVKLALPPESLDTVMEAFTRTAGEPTALVLKMRNDDAKMAAALLGMLDLLDANWGQWKFNPAKQKVEFADHNNQEKFLDLKETLDRVSLEQLACQAKLAALEPRQ